MLPSDPLPGPQIYRVLLVDDDPHALKSLRLALMEDFEVEAYESTENALVALERRPFHVVCSDFRMPEMDGAAFLTRVLAVPDPPSCVLISGTPLQALSALVDPLKAVAVVSKPYDPARLIRLVGQLATLAEIRRSAKTRRDRATPVPRDP